MPVANTFNDAVGSGAYLAGLLEIRSLTGRSGMTNVFASLKGIRNQFGSLDFLSN